MSVDNTLVDAYLDKLTVVTEDGPTLTPLEVTRRANASLAIVERDTHARSALEMAYEKAMASYGVPVYKAYILSGKEPVFGILSYVPKKALESMKVNVAIAQYMVTSLVVLTGRLLEANCLDRTETTFGDDYLKAAWKGNELLTAISHIVHEKATVTFHDGVPPHVRGHIERDSGYYIANLVKGRAQRDHVSFRDGGGYPRVETVGTRFNFRPNGRNIKVDVNGMSEASFALHPRLLNAMRKDRKNEVPY